MIDETLLVATEVGMFVFIVAGMASMGLSLTLPRILEPLRERRMVALLLADPRRGPIRGVASCGDRRLAAIIEPAQLAYPREDR